MHHAAYAERRRDHSFIEALIAIMEGEPERAICVAEDVYIPAHSICRAFVHGWGPGIGQEQKPLTPTGHPGERVDEEGRRWYSAAFLNGPRVA